MFPYKLKQMEILSTIVLHTCLFKPHARGRCCSFSALRKCAEYYCFSSVFLRSTQIQTHAENFPLEPEELSLGPLVGGVSKLPSNHIHAVTGGVPGHIWTSLQLTPHSTRRWGVWGWEGILAKRAVYAQWQVPLFTQSRSFNQDHPFWLQHVGDIWGFLTICFCFFVIVL